MQNLFQQDRVSALTVRVAQLRPDNARQWGTMTPAQAMAHCANAFAVTCGESAPPRALMGYAIGWLIKPLVFRSDEPLRRNTPTVKGLAVTDERVLDRERERLLDLIDRFAIAGPAGCTTHPHSFFGRLTPEQWAILMYKHLDHHLRQFGV